jgi:hypothetical protein
MLKRRNNLEIYIYIALIAKEKKVGRKIINYSSFVLRSFLRSL